jgi:hypothetical protein
MQVFTGRAEKIPLALMLKENVPANLPLDFIQAQKLMEVDKLSKTMTEIYQQVAEKAPRGSTRALAKHSRIQRHKTRSRWNA